MVDYDMTPQFMYGSIFHWHRLVNGYSGFTPPDYHETRERMRTFPDDEAIERLTELGVRYVVVHQAYCAPDKYADLMERILHRAQLRPMGHYRDWVADTQIFSSSALPNRRHNRCLKTGTNDRSSHVFTHRRHAWCWTLALVRLRDRTSLFEGLPSAGP